MKDVKEIGEYIHELDMECVPLIQSIGHLGWALYEDQFSHLRENGEYTELCPLHPEALPKIMSWIDEAVELHPHCRYIHLGADESTHLGSCPECRAAADPADPLKNYLAHVSKLCSHAIAAGKRPMIWSDMLWENPESAKRLPPETILPPADTTVPADTTLPAETTAPPETGRDHVPNISFGILPAEGEAWFDFAELTELKK